MHPLIAAIRAGESVERYRIEYALKAARELYPQLLGDLYKSIVAEDIAELQHALEHLPPVPPITPEGPISRENEEPECPHLAVNADGACVCCGEDVAPPIPPESAQ